MDTTTAIVKEPTLKDLRQRFPAAFGRGYKPLRVGVLEDLVAAFGPAAPRRRLCGLLGAYTGKRDYLSAVQLGGPRVGLDGAEHGAVTAAEQEHARQMLAQLDEQERTSRAEYHNRAVFVKAVEASGLSTDAYADAHGLAVARAHSDFVRGRNERTTRRQARESLVARFEASGLSADAFAARARVPIKRLAKAIEKVAGQKAT